MNKCIECKWYIAARPSLNNPKFNLSIAACGFTIRNEWNNEIAYEGRLQLNERGKCSRWEKKEDATSLPY